MTYQILRDAGYKTGLFIGPHLVDVRERFVVDDVWIDDDSLIEIISQLEKLDFIPTRFEKYVITMLFYFQKMQVDYAVVEVGM
jgi:dihydrofolate synthase / folylpolyglutamate synthase